MIWPVVTGWPGSTERLCTVPARWACTSFSIFMASTTQSTRPGSTSSPSDTETERTVPCIGETTASLPPAPPPPCCTRSCRPRAAPPLLSAPLPPPRERTPLRLGLREAYLESPPVHLDRANPLRGPHRTVIWRGDGRCPVQLGRARSQLRRLDDAVARLPRHEARMRE